MCGVAGIFNFNGVDLRVVEAISDILRHRGPDDEGFMIFDENYIGHSLKGKDTVPELFDLPHIKGYKGFVKLALIHRRLSIIDLKPTGHQPMSVPEFKLSIIYNGEIYNYLELRQELIGLGYSFKTDSDTEVIIMSYRQWSEKCVEHFLGMWAFVIFDQHRNILFCSRDRFGIKPFYYHNGLGLFTFASEIKGLFSLCVIKPHLDKIKAIEFLANSNMSFNGETIFTGINELLPGHNLIYDITAQKSSIYRYYQLEYLDSLKNISIDDAVKKFDDLIDSSIDFHLRSDVPIGTCLSGGLDSGTILSRIAKKDLPYGINTFTASFPGLYVDETQYVKSLSKIYKFSDYYTYPDINQVMSESEKFLWHQDLPVMSTSMFAQWKVMELAHEKSTKVLLDGQGMDEILGGYSEFTGAYLAGNLLQGKFLRFFRQYKAFRKNYKTSSINNELGRAFFYNLPEFLKYGIYSHKRLGPSVINQKYNELLKGIKFERRIFSSIHETSISSVNNVLPALLRYEDRSSMAFSIESRVPFLDHRIAEFCINLPEDLKMYNGWTKYPLRKASEPFLPIETTWRKNKFGFITPESTWTKEFHSFLPKFLSENEIPKIIDAGKLIKIMDNNNHSKISLGEIWKIVLFIKWFNVFHVSDD